MWRATVERWYPKPEFRPGVRLDALRDAERRLGHELPGDLRDLLIETDGVTGAFAQRVVWSLQQIVDDNLAFRSEPAFRELYMPFDSLLFFADPGNGDQFAFRLVSVLWDRDVFAWDHENDSRTWVAGSFTQYLAWWADGRIST